MILLQDIHKLEKYFSARTQEYNSLDIIQADIS